MTHSPPPTPVARPRLPLHSDISQCATDLWVEYGRPEGRDVEIWLEAERRLSVATAHQNDGSVKAPPARPHSGGRKRLTPGRTQIAREPSPPGPESKAPSA